MKRTRTFIVHLLLVVLQLTLLQWSMQVSAALPADGVAAVRECETAPAVERSAEWKEVGQHECCSAHMELDCQYHCSAGSFAFLHAGNAGLLTGAQPSAMPAAERLPDSTVATSLYRPPRTFIL